MAQAEIIGLCIQGITGGVLLIVVSAASWLLNKRYTEIQARFQKDVEFLGSRITGEHASRKEDAADAKVCQLKHAALDKELDDLREKLRMQDSDHEKEMASLKSANEELMKEFNKMNLLMVRIAEKMGIEVPA